MHAEVTANAIPVPIGIPRTERADWRARCEARTVGAILTIILDDGPQRMLNELDAIDALVPADINPQWTTVARVQAFVERLSRTASDSDSEGGG